MGLFGGGAEFIADGAIYGKLRELIAEASEVLIIVSPYVEPTDDFVREIERAVTRTGDVRLVFRRDRLATYRQEEWFDRFASAGVELGTVERLHSKLYVNERRALVTSMNFNRSSGENSFETGVVFDSGHKVVDGIEHYLADLEPHIEGVGRSSHAPRSAARSGRRTGVRANPANGHCLRCGESIPLNPKRPYCGPDYEKWAEFQNVDFPDRYCHGCGRSHSSTMAKPLCAACFRRAV